VAAAAARGEKSAIFAFDESLHTLFTRSASLGIPLREMSDKGLVSIKQVDPAELSPGEFSHLVRNAVEPMDGSPGAKVLVIDSLNGYLNATPEEKFLTSQLHEMLTYLGQLGVTTIMVVAQHGLIGSTMQAAIDASYLADGVIMLRYFEAEGQVRQAISVVKKRSGTHERSIREFQLTGGGIKVGPPLSQFRGVLTGVPQFVGESGTLMNGGPRA
jgi:circadian clock protein KaiC